MKYFVHFCAYCGATDQPLYYFGTERQVELAFDRNPFWSRYICIDPEACLHRADRLVHRAPISGLDGSPTRS